MKHGRLLPLIALLLLFMQTAALAQPSLDFDGTVVGTNEVLITAPIGGKAEAAPFRAGEKVKLGDALISLKTTKVYAPESGTVTGLFAREGDSIAAVESRYGGVLFIEPAGRYTIAATTAKAYDSASTRYIHVGEKVYLACNSNGEHTGEGIVTAVSGTGYTVEATSGDFYMEETVNVYRASSRRASSRLGRGDVARIANVAVTGTGSVVKLYVQNGDSVDRGQLLFETLEGEYDAYYCSGTQILSPVSGILSEMRVAQGDDVAKNAIVASVYPDSKMQIEFQVTEADLSDIVEGAPVNISFNWSEDADDAVSYAGTVASILHISATAAESGEASYTAYVDFAPGEEVRVGMTVVVTPVKDAENTEDTEAAADAQAEAEDAPRGPGADFDGSREARGERADGEAARPEN